jgi:hypothetical protein
VFKCWLAARQPGQITETAEIEKHLSACWDLLTGDDGGIEGSKLHGRMENVRWEPPYLVFTIERHGGATLGSSCAELQTWSINLQRRTRKMSVGKRLVRERSSPLKVEPIAQELAALVNSQARDHRLKWKNPSEVRIVIAEIIPDQGPQETAASRKKKLNTCLTTALAGIGWRLDARWKAVRSK